jgi:hypothetical protein
VVSILFNSKRATGCCPISYALSDIHKPMGVSEYELTNVLPKELKSALPSIEEIEEELKII